jgi:hypothetical protein
VPAGADCGPETGDLDSSPCPPARAGPPSFFGDQASAAYPSEASESRDVLQILRRSQRRNTDESRQSQEASVALGTLTTMKEKAYAEADSATNSLGLDGDATEVVARIHAFWALAPDSSPSRSLVSPSRVHRPSDAMAKNTSLNTNEDHFGAIRKDHNFIGRSCILRPNSTTHLAVALMSLAVMLYDVLSLPLVVAFRLEGVPAFYFLDLGACVFWTFDIVLNFFTGYIDNDRGEMRLRKIAQRYLRTWFAFDFVVVGFDWATQLVTEVRGLGFARSLKTPRMLRILFRTLRLLRVVKVVMVLEDVVQFVVSDWLSSTLGIAKLLLGMCIFNHFVACGWYAVGNAGTTTHWVDELEAQNASKFYLYIISFHWSMTQYTPAPNGYHPQNEHERLYACLTLLIGISVFSVFLGKITSLLTHMGASAFARSRDLTMMRQYLVANMVSLEVANRINVFLKKRQASRRVIPYSEVRHFLALPYSLAMELRYQAHTRALDNHPLLGYMSSRELNRDSKDEYLMLIVKVCSRAVTELGMKWGDELLQAGCPATQMIFVKHGKLQYINQVAFVDEREQSENAVTLGVGLQHQWACEMALWCDWYCHGVLQSNGVSVVLSLDAHVFHMLVADSPTIFSDLKRYSEAYTRRLTDDVAEAEKDPQDRYVDDCWGQLADVRQLTEHAFNVSLGPLPRKSSFSTTSKAATDSGSLSNDMPPTSGLSRGLCQKYLFGLLYK